jgi:hypothetical protein
VNGNIAWLRERELDDPGRLRTDEDRPAPGCDFCDNCGADVGFGAVSLAGLGLFCGSTCATLASMKHALTMARRR